MLVRALLILLCLCSTAFAGGRGGHSITFDPNSFGGNWTTINCTGSDDTAFNAWVTAAKAANPAIKPLRITGNCVITPSALLDGIQNVVIWAYGSTISDMAIGFGPAFLGIPYFTQSASAGATSVILNTAADAANFTVGQYMIMTGLEVQYPDCGAPPNTQFFDYALITSITGTTTKTINFSPPLTNNYSSTWPLVCGDGPAAAFPIGAAFQTNIQIFGMTMNTTVQNVIRGKTVQITDSVFRTNGPNSNVAPTMAMNISISNSFLGATELDKLIDTISYHNVNGGLFGWFAQSASVHNFNITNSTVRDFIGTALNTRIVNSRVSNFLNIGPFGYGAAQSLVLDGTFGAQGVAGLAEVLKAPTSYSAGTISLPLTDPNTGSFVHMAVPGFKYVLAGDKCPTCGSPLVEFTINAVRVDATNYYWDTSLVSTPTATCGGSACLYYTSFGAQTIKQTNTPIGGVNYIPLAAP